MLMSGRLVKSLGLHQLPAGPCDSFDHPADSQMKRDEQRRKHQQQSVGPFDLAAHWRLGRRFGYADKRNHPASAACEAKL